MAVRPTRLSLLGSGDMHCEMNGQRHEVPATKTQGPSFPCLLPRRNHASNCSTLLVIISVIELLRGYCSASVALHAASVCVRIESSLHSRVAGIPVRERGSDSVTAPRRETAAARGPSGACCLPDGWIVVHGGPKVGSLECGVAQSALRPSHSTRRGVHASYR